MEAGGVVGVEHDQRVQIAVSGVEDIGHFQPVAVGHLADAAQNLRQAGGWDGAIHAKIIRADAPDGTERALTAFPDRRRFLGRLGHAQANRIEALADGFQAVEQIVLLGDAALDLDDQHGFGVQWVAGMGEGLAGVDGGAVHEFQRDGDNAGGDDGIDALAGDFVRREGGQHRPRTFGGAQDADVHLGHDGQHALAAGQEAEPVVAGGVEVGAADVEDVALDGDDLQPEQIVRGDAVFQAMGAAGVHVDVAADHAGKLGRRVGGVEEAVGGYSIGNADVGDPSLHGGNAIEVVNVQDAVHLHHAYDDRVHHRQRAARQRRAGATRHHADAVLVAEAQHIRDLFGGFRQRHGKRHLPIGGQSIGLVRLEPDVVRDQAGCRQQSA